MKKSLIFLGVVAAFSLTSCKKDRTCSCVYTSTVPGSTSSTDTWVMSEVSKKSAKVNCVSAKQDYTVAGTTYTDTRTCEIK